MLMAAILATACSSQLTYTVFEKDYYEPQQYRITTRLAPCGCIAQAAPDNLTPLNSTPKDYADYETLAYGERMLFKQLQGQLYDCQCQAGMDLVAVATTTTGPQPNEFISSAVAQAMIERVSRVLNLSFEACCDVSRPTKSYRIVPGRFTFEEAVADAARQGGSLGIIQSREDSMLAYTALQGASSDLIGDGMFAWIALRHNFDAWYWVATGDRQAPNYGGFTNFGFERDVPAGAPNPCGAVAITQWSGVTSGTRGQWNALSCSTGLPYLLELQFNAPAQRNLREVTIIIAVLLGLFLLASLIIIAKKVLAPSCGGKNQATRRVGTRRPSGTSGARRRRSRTRNETGDTEMADVNEQSTSNTSQHLPRSAPPTTSRSGSGSSRRTGKWLAATGTVGEAGGRPSEYSPAQPRPAERSRPASNTLQEANAAERREQARRAAAEAAQRRLKQAQRAKQQQQQRVGQPPTAAQPTESKPEGGGQGGQREDSERRESVSNGSSSVRGEDNGSITLQPLDVGELQASRSVDSTPQQLFSPHSGTGEDPLSFLDALPPASPDRPVHFDPEADDIAHSSST